MRHGYCAASRCLSVATACSCPANLSLEGKRSLTLLLAANKRLNTAYVLKESFGQLWDYEREGWARRFFENWRASLKWQRLAPYEKFAEMIDRHWDGIAAYCKPENKVSLGFVEIQRPPKEPQAKPPVVATDATSRTYGFRVFPTMHRRYRPAGFCALINQHFR